MRFNLFILLVVAKILSIRKINEDDIDFYLNPNISNHIPEPSKIKDSLEDINEMFYANLLASVIKHCIETSQKLNDDIKVLIERI